MPLESLLRALPIVLLLGTVPGLALATLISPRLAWAERLAIAPGLSAGCVGVVGLCLHRLHIGFQPLSAVPILLLLTGAAVLRARRAGPGTVERRLGRRVTAVALLVGVVLGVVVTAAYHSQPLPPGDDPSLHAAVAERIVQTHDALPVLPIPETQSGYVRQQAALETTDALASELGGGTPADLLLPLVLLSLLTLPLGVALLAHEAFGDRRVAAVAALLSAGLVFPASPLAFGGYPYIVDSTLVVGLILAVTRCVRGADIRASAAMVGAIVLAMWAIHGLEILTAIVIGGPLWVAALGLRRWGAWPGIAAGAGAAAIAALVGHELTKAPPIPAGIPQGAAGPSEAAGYLVGHAGVGLGTVLNALSGSDLSILTGTLLCAGLGAVVLRRRGRWLLAALVLPLLCTLDIAGPERLHALWIRVYPWSVTDRVLGLEFFVIPVLGGIGAVAAVDLFTALRARSARALPARREAVLGGTLLAALGAGGLAVGALHTSQVLTGLLPSNEHATAADVAVIEALATHLPSGAVVLNDGTADAGEWIAALTPDVGAEPKAYASGNPDDWRIEALASSCTHPSQALSALSGVQAVFVGSPQVASGDHPWSASCIGKLPGLRLVAGTTSGPAAFVVSAGA